MSHRNDQTLESRAPRHARNATGAAPLGPYEMRYDVSRGYDEPLAAAPRRDRTEPVYGARRASEH